MLEIIERKRSDILKVKVDVELVVILWEEKDRFFLEIVCFCDDVIDVDIDVDNLMIKF